MGREDGCRGEGDCGGLDDGKADELEARIHRSDSAGAELLIPELHTDGVIVHRDMTGGGMIGLERGVPLRLHVEQWHRHVECERKDHEDCRDAALEPIWIPPEHA